MGGLSYPIIFNWHYEDFGNFFRQRDAFILVTLLLSLGRCLGLFEGKCMQSIFGKFSVFPTEFLGWFAGRSLKINEDALVGNKEIGKINKFEELEAKMEIALSEILESK